MPNGRSVAIQLPKSSPRSTYRSDLFFSDLAFIQTRG